MTMIDGGLRTQQSFITLHTVVLIIPWQWPGIVDDPVA
jgi:hypothetical protein